MHHGINIGEIDVYVAVQRDDFRNAFHSGRHNIVCHFKSLTRRQIAKDIVQPVVTHHQHTVHKFAQLFNSLHGLPESFLPFGRRRNGNHGNGENIQFTGKGGNYRSGASACATAHSSSYKKHFGRVFQHTFNVFIIFTCRLFAHFGHVPGASAFGERNTQLNFYRHRAVFHSLRIGIANDEVNTCNPFFIHVVDGIATAPAHSDHLYD